MRAVDGQDFGAIVRQRRLDLAITQEELATRVGRTRQWLSRLERGVGDVSLADALQAARELGLVIDVSQTARSSMASSEHQALPAAVRQVSPAELARLTDSFRAKSSSAYSATGDITQADE